MLPLIPGIPPKSDRPSAGLLRRFLPKRRFPTCVAECTPKHNGLVIPHAWELFTIETVKTSKRTPTKRGPKEPSVPPNGGIRYLLVQKPLQCTRDQFGQLPNSVPLLGERRTHRSGGNTEAVGFWGGLPAVPGVYVKGIFLAVS